jgi:hypothetical protein
MNSVVIWGRRGARIGNTPCKGPGVTAGLSYFRKNKRANVTGAEGDANEC